MESTAPPTAGPAPGAGSPAEAGPIPTRRADVDFLPDPFPAPRLPTHFNPAGFQRVVVNPFLGVAGLIGWAWLFRRLVLSREPPMALAACLLLAWLPFLIHYHCLDCGVTGLWHRWRRHACPRVVQREARNRRGWFRWPRATTQLVLWVYLLGGATILIVIASQRS